MVLAKCEVFTFVLVSALLAIFITFLMDDNNRNIFATKPIKLKPISMDGRINDVMVAAASLMLVTVTVILPIVTVALYYYSHSYVSLIVQILLNILLIIVLQISMIRNLFENAESDIVTVNYKRINVIFLGIGITHGILASKNHLLTICSAMVVATGIDAAARLLGAPLAEVIGSEVQVYLYIILLVSLVIKAHVVYAVVCTLIERFGFTVRDAAIVSVLLAAILLITKSVLLHGVLLGLVASSQIPGLDMVPDWYRAKLNEAFPWSIMLWGVEAIVISKSFKETIPVQDACQLTILLGFLVVSEVVIVILNSTGRVSRTKLLDFMFVFISMFCGLFLIEPSSHIL